MSAAFTPELIKSFDETGVVEIETVSPEGTKHLMKIWLVVVNGVPYVRSVRGTKGRWYRELLARGEGAIVVRGKRTPVKAKRDSTKAAIDGTSDALRRKYKTSGASLDSMLRADVLDTTVRLEPY
ncbi:MAG: DUF2255 family protein [Chloroflexota bacterium]